MGDLKDEGLIACTNIEGARKNRFLVAGDDSRQFQNPCLAYGVLDDRIWAVVVHAPILGPVPGERAVAAAISSDQSCVFEAPIGGAAPTRTGWIGEMQVARKPWVDPMIPVEVNTVPVDELFTAPGRCHAQGVEIKNHPIAPLGHTPWSRIEADRIALVGKVLPVIADLHGHDLVRSVVHLEPLRSIWWLRTPGRSLGKEREVALVHFEVLGGVVLPQVLLTDVVNDVVLL